MTTDAKNSRAREIYLQAVRMDNDQARRSYLDEACGSELKLRARVEKLLRANAVSGIGPLGKAVPARESDFLVAGDRFAGDNGESDFPNTSAMVTSATDAAQIHGSIDVSTHPTIGRYKLLEEIGHGGMGTVYMAQQTEPVKRKVALKIIKPGMDSKEVVARFEAERQALAMMDHPNVAKVLDGGTTTSGRPYFVMEIVHGTPITKFCDENRLSNRERIELFVDVCRAVQHAHMKGIIHRDLKPSNVLVTMNDDKPMPKVIDFGISKALSQPLTDKTMFTAFGQMIGTPLYMSPEQAQLSAHDVDVRSDIYSLGVLLYELLTGNTPFDRETLQNSGFDEMRRMIREVEPQRPSARISTLCAEMISTVADRRRADGGKMRKSLQGELDWIVMKALEKDRTRRYESANAFAADVQRYLDDEPVQACPPSIAYRMQKATSRHKRLLAGAAVMVATLLVATIVSTYLAIKADRERSNAIAAEQVASQNLNLAIESIDKLLQQASSTELRELPQAQIVRKQILEDVLSFYGNLRSTSNTRSIPAGFGSGRGDESSVRGLVASSTTTRNDRALFGSGRGDESWVRRLVASSTATRNGRALPSGHPPELRYRAALSWKNLAALCKEFNDIDRSIVAFQNALFIAAQLNDEFPTHPEYQRLLIDTLYRFGLNQRGIALYHSKQHREVRLEESRAYFEETLSFIDSLRDGELARSDKVNGVKLASLYFLGTKDLVADPEQRNEYHTAALQFAETQRENQSEEGCYGLRMVATALAKSNPDRAETFFRWLIENTRHWGAPGASRIEISGRIDDLIAAQLFFRRHDGPLTAQLVMEELELADQLAADFPNREWNQVRQIWAIDHVFALRELAGLSQEDLREPFLRRLQAAPSHHRTHLMRAVYLSRSDDSIESLTDAVAEYPMQSAYREFRGSIYFDRMQFEKGIEDFSAALVTIPEPVRLHRQAAWHSKRFTNAGRPEEGKRLIEMVHGFGTATPETEQALARALTALGRHREAERHFEKAEDLTPLGRRVESPELTSPPTGPVTQYAPNKLLTGFPQR